MIKFVSFKSKNGFLKILYGIVNIIISTIVGIINLLISFGVWFYKVLTQKYKYEYLYIAIISGVVIVFSIFGIVGYNKEQLYTWMGNSPSFVFIISLIVASILFLSSMPLYVLTIFFNVKVGKKYFWLTRIISYSITSLLLLYIFDIAILDFASRYHLATKPTSETTSYDVIVYFIKEYNVNFVEGIETTIVLALLGTIIGLILAFAMVSLRILQSNPRDNDFIKFIKKIGSTFASIYVTIIRGTPMIVQAFIFYYLVLSIVRPTMSVGDYRNFIDNVWTPFRAGLFTVSINTTAYLTEVLRGGIMAVDKGQKEAAEALGLSKIQTMTLIIFPQAIKNALPSIGNEFIINIKDTSVLTLIGVLDLFSVAKNDILGMFSAKSLEAYLIVAVYYLVITYLTSKLLQYFEKKMDMPVKGITSSN